MGSGFAWIRNFCLDPDPELGKLKTGSGFGINHSGSTTLLLSLLLLGVVCGNTYIMRPSERDPSACMALVELFKEAGVPDGVVNVIHGQHDTVNFICDHPDIKLVF